MKGKDFSILVSNPLDCEYIQKLAFKAGYEWLNGIDGVQYPETEQLVFRGNIITRCPEATFDNPETHPIPPIYRFPESAVKIHELFNPTVEYKEGDYVVLAYKRLKGWNEDGDMDKFLGSVQEIASIHGAVVEFESDETIEWTFTLSDIDRHASEKEIKEYKGREDIRIGGHKVEFFSDHIKIGCVTVKHEDLYAIKRLRELTFKNNSIIEIDKSCISYSGHEESGLIHKETFDLILKRIGK